MNEAPKSNSEDITAVAHTIFGRTSPFGINRSLVRGFFASIPASMTRLNDMPAVLAAAIAIITQNQVPMVPPPAKSTPSNAKGSAKRVCSIKISSENFLKSIFFPTAVHLFHDLFRHFDLIGPFSPHAFFTGFPRGIYTHFSAKIRIRC